MVMEEFTSLELLKNNTIAYLSIYLINCLNKAIKKIYKLNI